MKLIAIGDSFVWGSELSDSPHGGIGGHSNSTFPARLSQKNNLDYICAAYPGNSNQSISRTLMESCALHRNSNVVVLGVWTFLTRYEFRNNHEWLSINSWDADGTRELSVEVREFAKSYFKFNDSKYWEVFNTLKDIVLATIYLKLNNIPYLFTCADNSVTHNFTISNPDQTIQTLLQQIEWENWFWFPPGVGPGQTESPRGFYQWARENKYPCGVHGHPLEYAHQDAANLIQGKFHEMVKKHLESNQTGNSLS